MLDRIAFACVLIFAGMLYVEASVPAVPLQPAAPTPPAVVVPKNVGTPAGSSAASAEASAPASHDWTRCVYNVRQRSGTTTVGSAISLGGGLFVTASHVIPAANFPEIEVNGEWVSAGVSRVPGKDVSYLTISEKSLSGLSTRKAEYGEDATVFGMSSKREMSGMISADDLLSLSREYPGIISGDSGGAVIGDDGKLLGIMTATRNGNSRVIAFETFSPPAPYQQSQASAAATPAQSQSASPACANGTCRVSYGRRR